VFFYGVGDHRHRHGTLRSFGRRRASDLHYLDVTRHVRLEIGGDDLLALGVPRGPRVGEVMASVLRLKVNGTVTGRDQELAAARRLL
jgi:hypothetical protein